MDSSKITPITVFTGYLGAGKTTIITKILEQYPSADQFLWLKNEYGDVNIDSELVKETGVQVKEIVNGCLCCILIGRLGDAITEIVENYNPKRIIIETSGSAYPGPIALELSKLSHIVRMEAMITVVDVLNFPGYVDKSFTAKLQTKYTDLVLLNKHEAVDERRLDDVLDDIYELNPDAPKVKTDHGWVPSDLIFSLDGGDDYGQEVKPNKKHNHELERIEFITSKTFMGKEIENYLTNLSKENIYRLKGIFRTDNQTLAVNYVAGRFEISPLNHTVKLSTCLVVGERLQKELPKLLSSFNLNQSEVKTFFN